RCPCPAGRRLRSRCQRRRGRLEQYGLLRLVRGAGTGTSPKACGVHGDRLPPGRHVEAGSARLGADRPADDPAAISEHRSRHRAGVDRTRCTMFDRRNLGEPRSMTTLTETTTRLADSIKEIGQRYVGDADLPLGGYAGTLATYATL